MRTDRGSSHLGGGGVVVWSGGRLSALGVGGCLVWGWVSGQKQTTPLRKELRKETPCEHTGACENITFPHTPYAVGKYH